MVWFHYKIDYHFLNDNDFLVNSMIFVGLTVFCSFARAAYPQQNIEYDVFNKGKK